MQLRVARLCLDCEELHTESRCPRCISEHYAMVSTWLPVEERRRFRKPSTAPASARKRGIVGMLESIVRWIEGGTVVEAPPGWATRRSDHLARELNRDTVPTPPRAIDPRQTERADVAQ